MDEHSSYLIVFWRAFKIFLVGLLVVLTMGVILSGTIGVSGSFHYKVIFKILVSVGVIWAFLYWLENVIYHIVGMHSREIKERLRSTENRLIDTNRDLREIKETLNDLKKNNKNTG